MKKIINFFKGVKKELKKVKWPTKKEMAKYSIATFGFIIFFGLFFALTDLILALITRAIG